MAGDLGVPGRAGSAYERPPTRSAEVGRSPVSTPRGGSTTAVQSVVSGRNGTRNSNRGAH